MVIVCGWARLSLFFLFVMFVFCVCCGFVGLWLVLWCWWCWVCLVGGCWVDCLFVCDFNFFCMIDCYCIEGVFGCGVMVVVYVGYDLQIECEVVIKCLYVGVVVDVGYCWCFLVEVCVVGYLIYLYIVMLFDVGEIVDGQFYFVMEWLFGDIFVSCVVCEGLLFLLVVLELVMQMVSVFDYVYVNGVVYYDIKLENIMLVDGWWQVKIVDFGIVECCGIWLVGGLCDEIGGMLVYMVFEYLCGEFIDVCSDLFLLGVVLYWLLVGKLLWIEIVDVLCLLDECLQYLLLLLELLDVVVLVIFIDIVYILFVLEVLVCYQCGVELVEDLCMVQCEYEWLYE